MSDHELSAIPKDARAFQGHRAGIVTRVLAAAIDSALVGLVLVAAYLGFAGLVFLLDPRGFTFPDTKLFRSLLIGALVLGLYLTVAWAAGGRTYGNLLMGLRVVGVYGGDVGWVRALLRAAFYVLFPIGLLWVVLDPRQRSIQDRVLATSVVYDWQPHKPR
ncbi:RDD family protein [Nocardioides sp. URHA0032]|uniref:RDD family protein n=1 Tax=Nocardioides sp. URHA0032 TaxID=1380388 RepID=UPI00068462A1|nr:RDD family protein [Nocardioides sp. URHA0032]